MQHKKDQKLHIVSNDQIKFPRVRVSDFNGESLGIMSKDDAQDIADEQGLDLILVTEKADPPVCRITDAGKFRYELQKKEKENKKKQAESRIEIKEIRLRPVTDQHDLQIKAKHADEFLSKGHHVKITVRFRGRELANKEKGKETLQKLIEMIPNTRYIKKVEFSGRALSATIARGED